MSADVLERARAAGSAAAAAPPPGPRPAWWFAPAGVAIGFAGALCGIGGGIFAGPLLHATRGLALKRAAATALLVVLATTAASSVAEVLRGDSMLVWPIALPLAAGALVGAQLGYAISRRIDERALKLVFAVVLAATGARVLLFSSAIAGGIEAGSGTERALAFAIGVAGGTLTPLLGIAGGALMVPALFLSGVLGFGGARACALFAGALAAVRSLWLHARAGSVEFALGLPLAAGALVGGALGVVASREPALADGGRVLLGVVLLGQGARFAVEVVRRRRG